MYPSSDCPQATARFIGSPAAPVLSGTAQFCQLPQGVLVTVHVSGLPQNNDSSFFALHIHEGGSCTGDGFPNTGSHYNPSNTPHPGHAGDLPSLLSNGGEAYLSVLTNRFRLADVLGRTVVIHSGPDDFHSQPAGNAGTKIACGVISQRQRIRTS